MTRQLVHEDDDVRVYEVRDDGGEVVGEDRESKAAPVPSAVARIAALESRLDAVAALAAKADATATEVAAAAKPR